MSGAGDSFITSFKFNNFTFKNIPFHNIEGTLKVNHELKGKFDFYFFEGKGTGSVEIKKMFEEPSLTVKFDVKDINFLSAAHHISEEMYISGFANVDGHFTFSKNQPEFEVTVYSVKKKGVKQVMNFGAVKVLMALGSGNPVKTMGGKDFSYAKLAGKVNLKNGFLIIDGLAGKKGRYQYLLKSGFGIGGINVFMDTSMNTIKLKDFQKRIRKALNVIK